METQRRWYTVLRVKGLTYWQFSISLPSVLVNMCVVWDVKFKGIPNMDVQTAANVRTLPVKSSELLPDSSRTYKVRSEYFEVGYINFQEGKPNCTSYWAPVSRFLWSLCALKVNLTSTYGLGKAGVAVVWLRGITVWLSGITVWLRGITVWLRGIAVLSF